MKRAHRLNALVCLCAFAMSGWALSCASEEPGTDEATSRSSSEPEDEISNATETQVADTVAESDDSVGAAEVDADPEYGEATHEESVVAEEGSAIPTEGSDVETTPADGDDAESEASGASSVEATEDDASEPASEQESEPTSMSELAASSETEGSDGQPSDEVENGQTGSAMPDVPCEPPPRIFCEEASDCDDGRVCDVVRDWESACDASYKDKTCDAPCEPGDCPDFFACMEDGRCELESCVESSTPCPGSMICDADSFDPAGEASPQANAGCILVLCDHPEGPECGPGRTCDPDACSCVSTENQYSCSCEHGGDLLTGCRWVPCDESDVPCSEHHTCDPQHEDADDRGCVAARCDLGEVDCSELYEPHSTCKPECGTRFGCVTVDEGEDECGFPPSTDVP
jgi:hypothetical protein